MDKQSKIILISGPTASGKSNFAVKIAKKIKSIKDLEDIVDKALKSNQKTILIVIYNSQNQRRYIGVKLD